MEEDLKEKVGAIVTENNAPGKPLATIYCTCNGDKFFEASGSSLQTQPNVDQCSLNFSGLTQPNFCELDIITNNKKVVNTVIKFSTLQTTSAKLKGLPMVKKIPAGRSRAFRRTIGSLDEKMTSEEKPSEVLHLEKILLKKRDSLSDGALETKPPSRRREDKTNERKSKSKPAVAGVNSFIDNQEIVKKFDDLVNAKTMYFVDLPNKKVDGVNKNQKKTKKSNLGVEAGNATKKKNTNATSERNIKKEAAVSKPIIINRIENDVSQWNSVNSQSTLTLCDTTRERTVSEISVDCSFCSNKKSKERIHNNSPTSDVTIQEVVRVKPSRKRKVHKKRHENSEEEEEKIEDVVKEERRTIRKHGSAGFGEKKNQKADDEIKRNPNVPKQNAQAKGENEEEVKKRRRSKKRSYPEEQTSPQKKTWEAKRNILKENNDAEENNPGRNKSQDEVKVIFKDKRQEVDARRRPKTAQMNHTKEVVASIVASKNSAFTSGVNATKKNNQQLVGAKEKTQNLKPAKLLLPKKAEQEVKTQNLLQPAPQNDQSKDNSVLKLYVVDKLAPSTSSLKLTDDLLTKLKAERRKRASLRSRSKRPPALAPNQGEKQKRRSKSRVVTKEEVCTTSKGGEDNVERWKSASDVSKKQLLQNFDVSASVEGRKMGLPKLDRPKKSKASLSLSTTTFENNWKPKRPLSKAWIPEGVSTITEKYLRKTVRQENRKWLKSCTRKQYEFVCQYSEEENKIKSDTSVNRRKTGKALVAKKAHAKSVSSPPRSQTKSPKAKVYEELCELGAQQNLLQSSRNRFRVIRDSSASNKNNESQASSDVRSYKLKPRPSSEKEKEAILNLFKQNDGVTSTKKSIGQKAKKRRPNQIRTRQRKGSSSTSEEEAAMFRSLNEKSPKRRKRMRKCLFRREVSFTQLNVTPVQELYRERAVVAETPPEVLFCKKIERGKKSFAYKSQARKAIQEQQRPLLFKKEKKTSDVDKEKKTCSRKLSFFHMASGEKILEISTRAAANDGNPTIGFTVSGTEPPRRLRNDGDVEKSVSEKSQCHLQMTFLEPIDVNESCGFGLLNYPTRKKEDCDDYRESVPPDVKVIIKDEHVKRKKASPLITYKRVSKLCSHRKRNFRSLGKRLSHATKLLGKQKDCHEERPNGFGNGGEAKREDHNPQSCFNRFKLQAKQKSLLQSSTLQIIKEESHSTDSSRNCGSRRDQTETETPPVASSINMKDTQTDFESNDITKMKEVINYLYSAIERSKNLNGGIKTSEKHLQTEKCLDSSTESSSCCEGGRKLNRFKKIIKLSGGNRREAAASKNEEAKSSPVTTTGSSSYGNTSSTSNSKKSPATGPSSSSSGREVLSSSYFQKYKATKALIDSKRAKKNKKAKFDKAVLGGNFEPIVVANATAKVLLMDQAQNTSEKQASETSLIIKKFEDKSLQTTEAIAQQQVESNPKSDEGVYDAGQNPSNSTNSDGNAIVEKFAKPPKQQMKKKKQEKPRSAFERLKRVFGTKVMAEDDSDMKLVSGGCQSSPVVDYTSFIKFERHLEQVLGLYPSIFKAIRAQMDVAFANANNKEKTCSDLFQSKSTLATTVDTVTEYKNTECCYENPPNSVNDCLEHCCNCYHVWHKKYVVQQYVDSRDFAASLRSRKHEQRRKIEESRADKYDSSSSMKPNVEERRLKKSRGRKPNFDEACGLHSLTSVYSNDKGFLSSCSSISLEEKWSVASPLYGRTSSCEDLSVEKDASPSSQSLKINKIALPSEARRKSKSLIEVSTKKSVNRKLTLKQLLNEQGGNLMLQALSSEGHPNILLMSVSSSCTVFTTPSKFLAKVEKHLQIEKTPSPSPETESKIGAEDLLVLPTTSSPIGDDLPKCTTPRVDEKLYRKILFPNTARHLKINAIPKAANCQKPFYIHRPSEDNLEREMDSLEEVPQVKKNEEEEDFSADSLEIIKQRPPPKSCNYNMLYTSTTYVKPANQTYMVYSNTVHQYDKKLSTKHAERKHRDATDKKRRSTGVSDQNVSTTLISESGYESTKSKRTASIRNFFKKGGSLLDMFRSSIKTTKATAKIQASQNLTSFSKLGKRKEGAAQNFLAPNVLAPNVLAPKKDAATSSSLKDKSSGVDKAKIYWHSIEAKDKKVGRHEKKSAANCNKAERQSKCCPPEVIRSFPATPLGFSLTSYKKQKDECHAYAEKVLLESQLRKEGYYKQYRDFKEMPLELLIGKKMPCRPKHQQQTSFVQASPKSTPMSIQTEAASAKENKETDKKSAAPKAFVAEEKIVLQTDFAKTTSPAIDARQSKEDATPPSFNNFKRKSKKEVRIIQQLEEKGLGKTSSSTSSRVVIIKSKSSGAKEVGKSKLCTSSFQLDSDGETSLSTKESVGLHSKTPSEESSDGFHELYVNSSRLPTQLIQPESEDGKSKMSEESLRKTGTRSKTLEDTLEKPKSDRSSIDDRKRKNIAETSGGSVSKSRSGKSKISKRSKSKALNHELHTSDSFVRQKGKSKALNHELHASDSFGRQRDSLEEIGSKSKRKRGSRKDLEETDGPERRESTVAVVADVISQIRFRSRSNNSGENSKSHASDSERLRSSPEETNLKSKGSFRKDLADTDAPERRESTVAIAKINQIRFKSRPHISGETSKSHGSDSGRQRSSPEELNLKSKRKRSSRKNLEETDATESTAAVGKMSQNRFKSRPETSSGETSKSKGPSTSTISKKSESKSEEMKHSCRCKEETLSQVRERKSKDSFTSEVLKKVSEQDVPEAESDTLQSIPVVPSDEEVDGEVNEEVDEEVNEEDDEEENEPDIQESVPVVSSIIDVIVSKSVTDDVNQAKVSEPKIHESIAKESSEAAARNVSDDFRKGLTDKEVFEKLLESYEKKDVIAARLSKDDDFFKSQIDSLRRQSDYSMEEESNLAGKGSKVFENDPHRSTHFWEEKMRQMRTKEDNPVKADDIGVCFARGFRPDNVTLSGDACFNLNKQDRLTFSARMLSDQESIIDFSERETPLDYLLALGFMVDEASNALKDEDIRSRLLAAITEARVWVNKITTTQGTLLYLVAYKSRPKTMRYFLQLVEAIINRRINNAIKLDGFLRILEQVEEGEIQMINILGAEKFEDEESEEKIVRKQLKQLFITVYKIAEHESFQRGKALSQESILLLRILAAKYRAGLHPHLELIARYIGQELLTTETQLEAAMIFLSRLDTAEVKLKEFEAYCDIRCEKKKKTTEGRVESTDDNEKTAETTKRTAAEKTKSTAAKTKGAAEKTKHTEKAAKSDAKAKSKK